MAYFQTKDGSLEESIRKAVSGIQEKVEYVEYKFKNKNDAMKAKKMLDAIQLMGFEINDDNISNGEISVDAGNRDMTKYHKDIMKKFRPKVMTQEKLVGGQKKLDKDKDGDIDGKDFAMLRKAAKKDKKEEVKEYYEMGTDEYRKHTQDITPGQSVEDYGRFKMNSMKKALAKVWGLEEEKDKKDLTKEMKGGKTLTGKKVDEVDVEPKMSEKKK